MKIIIGGAGAVGTHLAELLSRENQDIVIIDDDNDRLDPIRSHYDLMAVTGSPSSIDMLNEVGVSKADLFVAVTPDENRNLMACILASKLGVKKTLARIDNYEYLEPENAEFFKNLGVGSLIYPEMLAANEIVSSIRMSWVRQWWKFGKNGELILIGAKIREKCELLNLPLREIKAEDPYHIVAIRRDNETIIPRGSDFVQLYDIVFFITTPEYIPYVRKIAGKEDYKDVHKLMIMGGSRIAMRTSQTVPDNLSVKIIEQDPIRCELLNQHVGKNTIIINGDARDISLLKEENIEDTDAFVATTGNSEANILACLNAKRLGINKTVAEVENLDYISMADSLDIGTIINKKKIAAAHIYQMLLDEDVTNVRSLTFSNADVVEYTAGENDAITKNVVKDLGLPVGVIIGGVIREGKGIIVNGNTQIVPGDDVVLFCVGQGQMLKKIDKFFK